MASDVVRDVDLSRLVIGPARDNEARAGRILLPELFGPGDAPDLLIARLPEPLRVIGAAALGKETDRDGSLPAMVHVVPAWRGRGVGRALVRAAAEGACGRARSLGLFRPVPAESQAAAFLRCCGFEQTDRIVHFEVDGLPFYADVLALRQRLDRHQRIPASARIVRLKDADQQEVAALVCRSIPASRALVLARLRPDGPNPYDLENSVVLLDGGVVRGVLIYVWNGGLPVIEVRAVDPVLRGSWANALMLEEATRNAKQAGALRFHFFASDRLHDTMRLAQRARAETIRIELQFALRVGSVS